MMSKIRSSKLANAKFLIGIAFVAALIIIFACEQKESVRELKKDDSLKMTIVDGKLKIEGEDNQVNKVKELFKNGSDFKISDEEGSGVLVLAKSSENDKLDIDEIEEDSQVFFVVEEMPEFPGGSLALRQFIAGSIKYPVVAQENGIQGKVYVTFVVGKKGDIQNARIARGVDPSLDKEALRVVNILPTWKPGKQRGKNVRVSYTVPINFVLQ